MATVSPITPTAPIVTTIVTCVATVQNGGTAEAKSETDVYGMSLNLSYELTEALTLKSITAWRDLDSEFARDGRSLASAYFPIFR